MCAWQPPSPNHLQRWTTATTEQLAPSQGSPAVLLLPTSQRRQTQSQSKMTTCQPSPVSTQCVQCCPTQCCHPSLFPAPLSPAVLPVPTDVEILLVNATAVRVQWSFDYSGIRPPTLRHALNFAVEVTVHISPSHVEVERVPGDRTYLIFTKVVKYREYTFRVTAQSGATTSHASQPSDSLLGGVSSCPLPARLRVTAVQAFSVTLAWEQLCAESIADPLYYIKYGSSAEEVRTSQVSLHRLTQWWM